MRVIRSPLVLLSRLLFFGSLLMLAIGYFGSDFWRFLDCLF